MKAATSIVCALVLNNGIINCKSFVVIVANAASMTSKVFECLPLGEKTVPIMNYETNIDDGFFSDCMKGFVHEEHAEFDGTLYLLYF